MIAVWILLGLLCLIAVLLMLPLRLFMRYTPEDDLSFYVKVLFFKFDVTGKTEQENKPDQPVPKKTDGGLIQQLLSFLGLSDVKSIADAKRSLDAKGLSGTFNELFAVVKPLVGRIFRLLHHCSFRKFDLQIHVAGDDAADAAFDYGIICAAVYPLVGLLESVIRFRRRSVDIQCDYSREKTDVTFFGQLNVRILHLFRLICSLIGENIRRTLRREDKKE